MNSVNVASGSTQRFAARLRSGFAAMLCAVLAGTVGAQDKNDEVDPPGRVGRIADLTGSVQIFSPGAGEWVGATRNRPITSGDRLATDPGARAEVRIGSTTVRLDSSSEMEVLRIDDSRIELQLHTGAIAARLRSREAVDEFELRTGEGRFRALRTGRYRLDRIDETSHLTAHSGSMVYEGPGSALTVYSGQRADFWLDAANAAQYTLSDPRRDAFAAWNSERDRADDRSASTSYVSPEMTGVEDLDRYGRWEPTDEYGPLWIPRGVPSGWAPYSSGHWVWVHPWGWTWVDDAPWGFAPFHYGRWVWHRSNWCWAPGTRVLRPVYAPALVAWVGGPRVGVSISIGAPAVGWFPLAPREVYVPSYRVSPRYLREVNVTHVTQITNVTQIIGNPQGTIEQRDFSNRKFPHAITVVPANVLTQRQPVGPAAAQLRERHDARRLNQAVMSAGTLAVAPVAAPPVHGRTLDSQVITAPGIGATGAPPGQRPAPRAGAREVEDRRYESHLPGTAVISGPQRPPGVGTAAKPSAAGLNPPESPVLTPAVISSPNRTAPNPAGSPAAAAVMSIPAPAVTPPRVQAPAVVPAPVMPRAAPPLQSPPQGAAPGPRPPMPQPDSRVRAPRPPGSEGPAVSARGDAVGAAVPARAIHAERPGPGHGQEAGKPVSVQKARPADQPVRERTEQRSQEVRREGRDRPQVN